ncbi:MAG: glycosyltransferase [Opitutaceae bacterium]|nr:glycosyltransferase [Opitutaceae bacterium]
MTRILYLCSSWPLGRSFGGQLRALHIGRALKQVGKVTVLAVSSEADDQSAAEKTAAEFEVLPPILPRPTPSGGLPGKLRRAFSPRCMEVHGVAASAEDRARLTALVGDYDLVWVLNSRTPNLLRRWHWPRSHLDLDDVPSTYLRTVGQSGEKPAQRWKARLQQRLMHRRELLFAERFTTLSVCSQPDKDYLGGGKTIHVIPNGFERPAIEPSYNPPADAPRIGFIGLYSYTPNADGVQWFLRECWPQLRQAIPGIRLRLIGKDTDGPSGPQGPDVDGLGFVADPAAEIATWSAMIIPIRFGGGTRIKIAEAFSRKCPAVSTRLGAFGYDVQDGRQLRLADQPAEFAQACVELVRDRTQAHAIAEHAWGEFLNRWTWDAIAPKVHAVAQSCVRKSE